MVVSALNVGGVVGRDGCGGGVERGSSDVGNVRRHSDTDRRPRSSVEAATSTELTDHLPLPALSCSRRDGGTAAVVR